MVDHLPPIEIGELRIALPSLLRRLVERQLYQGRACFGHLSPLLSVSEDCLALGTTPVQLPKAA